MDISSNATYLIVENFCRKFILSYYYLRFILFEIYKRNCNEKLGETKNCNKKNEKSIYFEKCVCII